MPFPPPTVFAALPQGGDLLRALAAYDVIGMQTAEDAGNLNQNFAANGLEARAEAFPIGIDPEGFAENRRTGRRQLGSQAPARRAWASAR